jgi:hypothetical protein
MSGIGKYFSEAYSFEEDCVYVLRHLNRPNTMDSTERKLRNVMLTIIRSMFHAYMKSLSDRFPNVNREQWLKVGRPSHSKMKADLRKYTRQIPHAARMNVWRP